MLSLKQLYPTNSTGKGVFVGSGVNMSPINSRGRLGALGCKVEDILEGPEMEKVSTMGDDASEPQTRRRLHRGKVEWSVI